MKSPSCPPQTMPSASPRRTSALVWRRERGRQRGGARARERERERERGRGKRAREPLSHHPKAPFSPHKAHFSSPKRSFSPPERLFFITDGPSFVTRMPPFHHKRPLVRHPNAPFAGLLACLAGTPLWGRDAMDLITRTPLPHHLKAPFSSPERPLFITKGPFLFTRTPLSQGCWRAWLGRLSGGEMPWTSLSLSLTLSPSHSHTLCLSHTYTPCHTLSLSLSLSPTHTHTHTLSLSLALSHTQCPGRYGCQSA